MEADPGQWGKRLPPDLDLHKDSSLCWMMEGAEKALLAHANLKYLLHRLAFWPEIPPLEIFGFARISVSK